MNSPTGMELVFRQIPASARDNVLRFVKSSHDGNMGMNISWELFTDVPFLQCLNQECERPSKQTN